MASEPTAIADLFESITSSQDVYTVELGVHFALQILFWWLPGITLVSLNYLAPSFSTRYKIQPAEKQPTLLDIGRCVAVSICNQAIELLLHFCLLNYYTSRGREATVRMKGDLPSLAEFTRDFVLSFIAREAIHYYLHRLLHWRPLYKRLHKIHHNFTAPIAFASQYAHPVEHILLNVLPITLPLVVLRSHVLVLIVMVGWDLLATSVAHSGYDFFLGLAKMHDRHHERFHVYFGSSGGFGIMDWAHRTNEESVVQKKVD